MSGAVAATSVDDRVLAGFSAISVAQLAAAHVIDGYIQRLHVNVTAAVADFSSCVGSLEIALAAAASDFRRLAR